MIIVYDITDQSSFENVTLWIDELKLKAPPDIVLAIAGNKIDLEDQRMVSRGAVEALLQELSEDGFKDIIHRECSAKTGQGVRELFEDVSRCLIHGNDNL